MVMGLLDMAGPKKLHHIGLIKLPSNTAGKQQSIPEI